MNNLPPILADLREATAADHARLEAMTLGERIMDGSLTLPEYDRILNWQASSHRALEPLVAGYALGGYFYRPRYDGGPAAGQPLDNDTATGIVYVLEGSSLGGSIIYRKLLDNPSLASRSPFAFYRDQAEWGVQHWRAFVASLRQREFDEQAIARARDGARMAFARFATEWEAEP